MNYYKAIRTKFLSNHVAFLPQLILMDIVCVKNPNYKNGPIRPNSWPPGFVDGRAMYYINQIETFSLK